MTVTIKEIRELGLGDSVGKNKAGNIVVRRGYFYRHGMDSAKYAERVLAALGDRAVLVDHGDVWRAFRGGASVANSSHFWVEIAAK